MTDQQATIFTNNIFDLIKKAKTISDLESISYKMEIPTKNSMKIDVYPKIEFSINKKEIQSLIDRKILDANFDITTDISLNINDPLTKLLYATAWKNGDLKKIKHIINGILDSETENSDQDEALVFYQFGKYLTKLPGEPIIDQHVIRAFAIHKMTNFEQITELRQMGVINKRHKGIIQEYKVWLTSNELTKELKNIKNYTYYIDKLLFATGKTIKKHGGRK